MPAQPCSSRVVWVRCFGVPLMGWDCQIFEKIGKSIGRVIGNTQETFDRTMMEYGRICAEVEDFSSINKVIKLQMCRHTFPVMVREEAAATKSSLEGMLDKHSVRRSMGEVPVSWDVMLRARKGRSFFR